MRTCLPAAVLAPAVDCPSSVVIGVVGVVVARTVAVEVAATLVAVVVGLMLVAVAGSVVVDVPSVVGGSSVACIAGIVEVL